MQEFQRKRWSALQADRRLIDRAAAVLRREAIRDSYAGLRQRHVAFALASILDVLSRHLPDLDDRVRHQIVRSCRVLLGEHIDVPAMRRTRRR